MRWLRYALLLWFILLLATVSYQTFLIWNVMTSNAVRETLVETIPALLVMLYIWRNPPRSKERVIDPIGVFKKEIRLEPPVSRKPGQDVLDAANRLKEFADVDMTNVDIDHRRRSTPR